MPSQTRASTSTEDTSMREMLRQLREELKRELLEELRNSASNGDQSMMMMTQGTN